jgi:lysophospholipase L1-like esterase
VPLENIHRIVFLGDSITQAGDYVVDFECYLIAHGIHAEVINLGLGSETATDLTEVENADHKQKYGFGRPFVGERLDRALRATKPDLLIACYGMNDGGSLPTDDTGTKRYAAAITHLRDAALKAGAKCVVLCTPPVQDAKGNKAMAFHDTNLTRYSDWLLSKRADGWDVVDFHGAMRKALADRRAKDPHFQFAGDGVHPGREGHWLIAGCIIHDFLGGKLDGINSAEHLFKSHGAEIRSLVHKRMSILFAAWMTKIGHKRPGVPGYPGVTTGMSIEEANAEAKKIGKQIAALIEK